MPGRLDWPELWPVLLVWLVLALLPIGRASELPLLVAAVAGVVMFARGGRAAMSRPAARLALVVFAGYWVPACVSAFDAVEPGKSWPQVAAQLRFAPFALFVAMAVRSEGQWRWLLRSSALLVVVWLMDAWLQALTGASLGGAMDSDRLSGIFGADNLKLGGVLAALSPIVLSEAQRRFGRRGLLMAALLLAGAILLAGARAAWLVYALVLAGLFARPFAGSVRGAVGMLALVVVFAAATVAGAYRLSPTFAERMDRTLHLADGTTHGLDHALAGRLPIWHTAVEMAQAHPVNGVGVRGFRHAYAQFASGEDPWTAQGGALHPHQLVLEVASETGLIGVFGWVIGLLAFVRAVARADADARARAWPILLALAAMCFPLNTHYAFYSSWWGLFFWWLIALAIAGLHVERDRPGDGRVGNSSVAGPPS